MFFSIIFLVLSASPAKPIFTDLLQFYFYALLGWTVATTLLAASGQLVQRLVLSAQVIGDNIFILSAIILFRGPEMAIVAFAVCVGAIAITIGLKGRNVLIAIAVAVYVSSA
ncbi:hypothetical protein [Sphingorhabdus sp. EL138]|uniref:hypothetical protein n=1 Tax=Sphingorhabdus sp. EL138 TaxID=2073156 RepID=UPI0025E0C92A|nr:hypothetical protein [Sphingorhabdus sp. EL138]